MLSISHDQTHLQPTALQALCISSFLHTWNIPVSTYWKGRKVGTAGLAQCDSTSLSISELLQGVYRGNFIHYLLSFAEDHEDFQDVST